jgi:uncharacterized membrane protein
MSSSYLLLLAFLLGCVCGLRSMTAPALVCWAAHLGWLQLAGSPLNFLASPISVAVFTLFAVGELIADKFPFIPSRVTPGPLIVRILFGALCGWALGISASQHASYFFAGSHGLALRQVVASQRAIIGILAGAIGGLAGAFAGYNLRCFLTVQKKRPDLPIALLEDACAIALGLFVVTRF